MLIEELKVGDMVRYIGPERTGLKKGQIGSVVSKTSSGYQVDGMMMRSGVKHKESDLQKITKEEAPANATGTAVAGTGDDSSTVVMKKKKDKETMKDRLLRRFKIKETIDRTVPDLERPKDEIKEKVKHLKAMAMKEADLDEAIKGLQNKAKKTGMPYSILKKVYDRGMAAWKGGHRPGATQQQWAFARVNSFVTKSSGTWGGADKDLAAKVRGSK